MTRILSVSCRDMGSASTATMARQVSHRLSRRSTPLLLGAALLLSGCMVDLASVAATVAVDAAFASVKRPTSTARVQEDLRDRAAVYAVSTPKKDFSK